MISGGESGQALCLSPTETMSGDCVSCERVFLCFEGFSPVFSLKSTQLS